MSEKRPKKPTKAPKITTLSKRAIPRRTQQERREGTIRKLLDAATHTLIEVGYCEASVQRICVQAGVSQGALFRHFPTREALMVAVSEDVGRQLLVAYRVQFEAMGDQAEDIVVTMRLVREACRSRLNQAWYELRMAARTNDNLRKGLAPVAHRYLQDIERLARVLLPKLAAALGERFPVLVSTLLATFDGEVMQRFVVKSPALEEARLELLAGAVSLFTRYWVEPGGPLGSRESRARGSRPTRASR